MANYSSFLSGIIVAVITGVPDMFIIGVSLAATRLMNHFITTTFFILPFVTLIDSITRKVIFYLIFIDILKLFNNYLFLMQLWLI